MLSILDALSDCPYIAMNKNTACVSNFIPSMGCYGVCEAGTLLLIKDNIYIYLYIM